MLDFLKNFVINLKAGGPAAVIIVWFVCVTALGLWGGGPLADRAMTFLAVTGGGVIIVLALRT